MVEITKIYQKNYDHQISYRQNDDLRHFFLLISYRQNGGLRHFFRLISYHQNDVLRLWLAGRGGQDCSLH